MSLYLTYYENQLGGGSRVKTVYSGSAEGNRRQDGGKNRVQDNNRGDLNKI